MHAPFGAMRLRLLRPTPQSPQPVGCKSGAHCTDTRVVRRNAASPFAPYTPDAMAVATARPAASGVDGLGDASPRIRHEHITGDALERPADCGRRLSNRPNVGCLIARQPK